MNWLLIGWILTRRDYKGAELSEENLSCLQLVRERSEAWIQSRSTGYIMDTGKYSFHQEKTPETTDQNGKFGINQKNKLVLPLQNLF